MGFSLLTFQYTWSLAAEIVVRIEKLERQVGDYCDVLIRVIDQGIGLSAEAQANIFADFAQAEKSTSRIYGGTGLGLAPPSQSFHPWE